MKQDTAMDNDLQAEEMDAEGVMITSLCWVSRGFARATLEEADFEADDKIIRQHMKMQRKLSK